jgi:hypothetical protein
MKADWVDEIIESITRVNREVSTFAMILYRHPRKEIGRKSEIELGEHTLGIRVTK